MRQVYGLSKKTLNGEITMRCFILTLCVLALAFLAVQAYSEDDPLGDTPATAATARQEIRESMGGEDIFKTGKTGTSLGAGSITKVPVAVSRDMLPSDSKTAVAAATSAPSNVAGRWSLILSDSMDRSVAIMLAQSDGAVFGRGYMIYGNTTQDVTATGTVSGTQVDLDLLAINDMNLYRLKLNNNSNLLSGDYVAYSVSIAPWTGRAEGNIA